MAETTSIPAQKNRKKKTAKAPITRLSKYGDFENEIVSLVVKPRIDHLLKQGVTSVNDLTQKFREAFDSGVSIETMKEWLTQLGYHFEKPKVTLTITGPTPNGIQVNPAFRQNGMASQIPSGATPQADEVDDMPGARFDNEVTPISAPPGASVATLRALESNGQVIDQPFRAVPSL